MNWTVGIGMIGLMALGGFSPTLVDRAVESGLKSKFGSFKQLSVESKADLLGLLTGKVGGVSIQAKDFKAEGLPVKQMELETGPWLFDTWDALKGKPRWLNEVEATASAVFAEEAVNTLVARPEVQRTFKNIRVNLPMAETADLDDLKVALREGRIEVKGNMELGSAFPLPFHLSGVPEVREHQLYVREVQLNVMGMALPSSLFEESLKRPLKLPILRDFRYQLESVRPQMGSLSISGKVWIPPAAQIKPKK